MKATVFLTLMLLTSLNSQAQRKVQLDSLELNDIQIHTSNKQFSLTEKSNKWESLFPKDLIEKDVKTDPGSISYQYEGLLVGFHNGDFWYAKIKNPQCQVVINNKSYKTGSNINELAKEFPLSFKTMHNDKWNNIQIKIRPEGAMNDDPFIAFEYDKNDLIIEIYIGNRN